MPRRDDHPLTSSRERLDSLQWLRAAAALMVVLFHADAILRLPKYGGAPGLWWLSAGDAGVQLFFVLSGFVILRAHKADGERSPATLVRFARKRVRRLYPPLWIVLVPLIPIAVARGASLWDVAAASLIAPIADERVLAVEWTLRHEMLFYAIFLLFLWRRRAGTIVLALWAGLSATLGYLPGLAWPLAFALNPNHALFALGMAAERVGKPPRAAALAAGALIFAATYLAVARGWLTHEAAVLPYGLGAFGLVLGLVALPGGGRGPAWLAKMGDASYMLYLIHFPLLSLLAKLASQIGATAWPEVVLVAIAAVVTQAVALAMHRWLERPALRLFDRTVPR